MRAVAGGMRYLDPGLEQARRRSGRVAALSQLSPREFEIFRQLAEGRTVDAIAQGLCLSQKTVANHGSAIRARVSEKLAEYRAS